MLQVARLCLVTFAIALASRPAAAYGGWGLVRTVGTGTDQITVLHVGGTPYQMGWWHGYLLQSQVEHNAAALPSSPDYAGIPESEWDGYIAQMWPHVPAEYDEELRGLADGSGVSYRELQKLHLAGDISEYHCSNFCAFGTATAGGHMIQMRVLDWDVDTGIQDNPLITVHHPDGGIRHVTVGFAGFIGSITSMNQEHVAMGEMGDDFGPQHETLNGEPLVFLMRDVIAQSHNYSEGYSIVQNAVRTSSLWYVIGDSRTPYAGLFQTAMDIFNVWGPGQSVYGWPAIADSVYGGAYMDRLYNGLATYYGALTPAVAQQIARANGIPGHNLLNVVYDVTTLELWAAYAEGSADAISRDFVHFDFWPRIYTFDDVTPASPQWPYVEALVREAITSGCTVSPPKYCPQSSITMGQMAVFIIRAMGETPYSNPTPTFTDVPAGHWAYGYVERMYQLGITGGCATSPLRYCPDASVNRSQMAVFLCRAAGKSPLNSPTPKFTDVPQSASFYGYVERLADPASWGGTAVTSGCATNPMRYCPYDPVTRGQMAVFIVRAFDITL